MEIQAPVLQQKGGLLALSKQEAAQMLGVSLRTIDRLIALKELQVRRLGRRVLIPRSALDGLMHKDHPTQMP